MFFFSNWKNLIYYYLLWFIVICVHFIILFFIKDNTFSYSFVEAFIYNIIFSFIGFIIWYVVFFSGKGKRKFLNLFLSHLLALTVSILVWIILSNLITQSLVGDSDRTISLTYRILIGMLYYVIITFSYYLIISYNRLKEKITNEARLGTIIKETELKALKSQINPHFLFNSLNSISSLTLSDPAKAQEMIINLSNFLRYSISQKDNHLSTLKEEIENINKYLAIEKIRFGERLNVIQKIEPECMSWKVPTMILQPLYENAIKYGVYESRDLITIETTENNK